jgi:hypothetical protein
MTLAAILPLSFVMIAGPQIISAIFLSTSRGWARNSLSYLAGAAVSVTAVVSLAFVVAEGSTSAAGGETGGTAGTVLDWIVLALLLFLVIRVYLTRNTSEPPKWMGRLQEASPRFAFLLGLALLGVFPTDILGSITAGLHVARHGDAWWQCLPFVAMTLLLLSVPAIGVVVLGRRAETVLPRIRDWMNEKSWVVSEIVLVFIAAVTVSSLLGG